ncbi:MAG TPA: Na+/H+ antiporter NhaA [Cryptosporangiaceae bacterium]|nr:Na+/H+ antiporter NhaA [Cryptosporangiaceae bacterium]
MSPRRIARRAVRAAEQTKDKATDASVEFLRFLRTETIGGLVLLAAATVALILANSGWGDAYLALGRVRVGPEALHLNLELSTWAKDGLLAVFFFVVGLELKRELVVGELREWRAAALPVFAAVGGMVVPAAVCLAVAFGAPGAGQAWPVPVATDIAFALAVLALTASALPPAVRLFLLSLAVVDDLGAITLIAVLFSHDLNVLALGGAAVLLVAYALLQRWRVRSSWLYVPVALGTWALVHEAGIHATVAGVALGLLTRVRHDEGERWSPAERLEHRLQPLSAAVCVPVFAFFAAGVPVDTGVLSTLVTDRIALAVIAGLLVGKFIGVFGGALLAIGLKVAHLPEEMHWRDLAAVSLLAGCGFTVSLLLADLSFGAGDQAERIKLAVLIASLLASLLAAGLLHLRIRARRDDDVAEPADAD